MKPLVSENFTNDAVKGTANLTASGGTSSVEATAVTVSYDAASGNYIVSTPTGNQSFRPGDRSAGSSTAAVDVYERTSGNTSDTLYLTTNSDEPGTPSSPKYKYVGGGIWQRVTTNLSGASGSLYAFSYGVETLDASLPRTGSATFDVSLRGAAAYSDNIVGVVGSGKLNVNFAGNSLTGAGSLVAGNEGPSPWATTATISSSNNSFAGNFGIGAPFQPVPGDMSGSIAGRFYGPKAEEVGASWYWRDSFLGISYAGVMLGKDSALFPTNTSLRSLVVSEDFPEAGYYYGYSIDTASGETFTQGGGGGMAGQVPLVNYSETDGLILYSNIATVDHEALRAADRDATRSDDSFDVYTFSKTMSDGKQGDFEISVLRSADDNPTIPLTYTSFMKWSFQKPDRLTYVNREEGWVAFGQATPANAIPTTGTATYMTALFGQSDRAIGSSGKYRAYDVGGGAAFIFDFGAGALSGLLAPRLYDPETSESYSGPAMEFAYTNYSKGSQTFSGSFKDMDGGFRGQFTGPAAEEMFASFRTTLQDPLTSNNLGVIGIAVGKKE